jgi:hypothetical protein
MHERQAICADRQDLAELEVRAMTAPQAAALQQNEGKN